MRDIPSLTRNDGVQGARWKFYITDLAWRGSPLLLKSRFEDLDQDSTMWFGGC